MWISLVRSVVAISVGFTTISFVLPPTFSSTQKGNSAQSTSITSSAETSTVETGPGTTPSSVAVSPTEAVTVPSVSPSPEQTVPAANQPTPTSATVAPTETITPLATLLPTEAVTPAASDVPPTEPPQTATAVPPTPEQTVTATNEPVVTPLPSSTATTTATGTTLPSVSPVPSATISATATPTTVVCQPDARRDVSARITERGVAEVTNRSTVCSYDVGLATYTIPSGDPHDPDIDSQKWYSDSEQNGVPQRIQSATNGQPAVLVLRVAAPTCQAFQQDVFYGRALPSLNGHRFGPRLLAAARYAAVEKVCLSGQVRLEPAAELTCAVRSRGVPVAGSVDVNPSDTRTKLLVSWKIEASTVLQASANQREVPLQDDNRFQIHIPLSEEFHTGRVKLSINAVLTDEHGQKQLHQTNTLREIDWNSIQPCETTAAPPTATLVAPSPTPSNTASPIPTTSPTPLSTATPFSTATALPSTATALPTPSSTATATATASSTESSPKPSPTQPPSVSTPITERDVPAPTHVTSPFPTPPLTPTQEPQTTALPAPAIESVFEMGAPTQEFAMPKRLPSTGGVETSFAVLYATACMLFVLGLAAHWVRRR